MAFQVDEELPNLSIRILRPNFLRTDNDGPAGAEEAVADVAFPTSLAVYSTCVKVDLARRTI